MQISGPSTAVLLSVSLSVIYILVFKVLTSLYDLPAEEALCGGRGHGGLAVHGGDDARAQLRLQRHHVRARRIVGAVAVEAVDG